MTRVKGTGSPLGIEPTDNRKSALRDSLLSSALELIAEEGLERLSLRAAAARAGGSTAAIVHHFRNKPGLLAGVMQRALDLDIEHHARINAVVLNHRVSQRSFAEWIAWYITGRANDAAAIFWSELLLKARMVAGAQHAIAAWHEMRCTFWRDVLDRQRLDSNFAPFLVSYLCMEEVCAMGLSGQVEYELLLRESVWTLISAQYHQTSVIEEPINALLDAQRKSFAIPVGKINDSPADRLLGLASNDLLARGIYSVNQRKIGKDAGTSGSMIIYYFGTMAEFERQAIWRAMVQGGFPPATHPDSDPELTNTLEKWSDVMAATICNDGGDAKPGYYCSFARIMGEVSLLSRRRTEMRVLIEHLRMLDGTASYGASQTIWRDVLTMSRNQAATFAMWVKGHAVLSNVLGFSMEDLTSSLTTMIRSIVIVAVEADNLDEVSCR